MSSSSCHINFRDKTVTLCDEMLTVNILRDFKSTKNLALLAKDVKIDPYSECLVPIVLKYIAPSKQRQFLVDPLPSLYDQRYGVGNALIEQAEDDHFFIPIKNFTDHELKINFLTPLAQLFPLTKNYEITPWAPSPEKPSSLHSFSSFTTPIPPLMSIEP